MKTRIMTAVVAVPILIILIILSQLVSPLIMIFLLGILSAIMVWELLKIKDLHFDMKLSLPALLFGFTLPLFSFTRFAFVPLYVYILLLLFAMVFFHKQIKFMDVCYCLAFPLIVTLGMSGIAVMVGANPEFVAFYVILAIATPWLADGGAYFAGVYLGKHKLCPNISPNKTIEGALGGVVAGVISTLLIGVVFNFIFNRGCAMNYGALLIIGLINTPLSMIGDLSFSVIKRNFGIKDFANTIPGHGGFLDRFDSVLITAPLIYVVSIFTTIIA